LFLVSEHLLFNLSQEKINNFLNQNAGAPDILDRLLAAFGEDGPLAVGASNGPATRRSALFSGDDSAVDNAAMSLSAASFLNR
jgi:hypothetical protein